MTRILLPLFFAVVAAAGNVFFVFGNRKVGHAANPFLFTTTAMAVCLAFYVVCWFAFGARGTPEFLRRNLGWCALSGFGMFLTFLGFYLLYSRFDTSYYALFSVVSILMTTLVLGVLILKEGVNAYGILSIAAAVASIVFFGLSKR